MVKNCSMYFCIVLYPTLPSHIHLIVNYYKKGCCHHSALSPEAILSCLKAFCTVLRVLSVFLTLQGNYQPLALTSTNCLNVSFHNELVSSCWHKSINKILIMRDFKVPSYIAIVITSILRGIVLKWKPPLNVILYVLILFRGYFMSSSLLWFLQCLKPQLALCVEGSHHFFLTQNLYMKRQTPDADLVTSRRPGECDRVLSLLFHP